MLFGLFKPKAATRSIKEIEDELNKLMSNATVVDPQYLPQLHFDINLKIAVLTVMKWYVKDPSISSLSWVNDNLIRHAGIVRDKIEQQNKKPS